MLDSTSSLYMTAESSPKMGLPHPTAKPERSPVISFNPEINILQNDWEEMLRMKNKLRKGKDWISFAHLNAAMIIADPKRASEFEITDEDWEGMMRLRELFRPIEAHTFGLINTAMKISDPQRAKKGLEITDEDWAKMMIERQSHTGGMIGPSWELVVLINANMLISDPERASELRITDEQWNGMVESRDARRTDNLYHMEMFAKISTAMKISDPTKDLKITEEDWKRMEELRQTYRIKEYWVEFAVMNMHIAILAAKTVKVTEKGIELGTDGK